MKAPSKDRAAWLGEHIVPHEGFLRAWLNRKTRGELEVDDIIQETYAILAACESVEHIRNPKSYAFQVAYSVIQMHMRRLRVVSFQSLTDPDTLGLESESPSPECEAVDKNFLRAVDKYLQSLPKNCRNVFVMRRVEQLSRHEIAQRLGISPNSVEKIMTKTLRLLMDEFGRGGHIQLQASNNEERQETLQEVKQF